MDSKRLKHLLLKDAQDLGEQIGKGAYCTVTKMKFRGLTCAGKKFHNILVEDVSEEEKRALLERFADECELLSRLHHPNIIQFLGVHETNQGIPILVMEYMEKSLTKLVEDEGPVSPSSAIRILRDVAVGLAYLHGHSPPIAHRDLSANNVLLTVGMRAKIADLGVARILNITPSTTAKMTMCPGTQTYMPPEALHQGLSYDVGIDCFSFGVLIIHVLSGQWPNPSPPTRINPVTSALEAVSEYDRREKYIQGALPKNHPLLVLGRNCLANVSRMRPQMEDVLKELEKCLQEKDAQCYQEERNLKEKLQEAKDHIKKLVVQSERMKKKEEDCELKLSDLQKQISMFESVRTHFEVELDKAQTQLEAKEKELDESQKRTTALKDQLQEYAGTIQDQNKVIHNYTHHGGLDRQYTKLQELNSRTTEFVKKQQIEFTEKIQDMEKKIKSINMLEFEEENRVLRESCEKMTRDIRDYQAQTKQLVKDIEARRKETLALKEELQRRREGCKSLEQANKDLQAQLKEKNEVIAFLQNVHDYGNEEEEDGEGVLLTSSTHSVPTASWTERKVKSGVIATTIPKVGSTPRRSYTFLTDQPPRRPSKGSFSRAPNPYSPSLNTDQHIFTVQIRTNRGLRKAYVQKVDKAILAKGMNVVVKREGGIYEEGVVRCFRFPIGELVVGIELGTDSQGASNNGVYKDNKRYSRCAEGHCLFTPLSNLYIEINVT